MDTKHTQLQRTKALQKWLQTHREEIRQYRGEFIAFNERGLLVHHHDFAQLVIEATKKGEDFVIDVVRSNPDAVYILPITIRSISQHQWSPKYFITLKHGVRILR